MTTRSWAVFLILATMVAIAVVGYFWGTCGARNRTRPGRCRRVAKGPLGDC